jgi:transposase InsO family protein
MAPSAQSSGRSAMASTTRSPDHASDVPGGWACDAAEYWRAAVLVEQFSRYEPVAGARATGSDAPQARETRWLPIAPARCRCAAIRRRSSTA